MGRRLQNAGASASRRSRALHGSEDLAAAPNETSRSDDGAGETARSSKTGEDARCTVFLFPRRGEVAQRDNREAGTGGTRSEGARCARGLRATQTGAAGEVESHVDPR